MQCKHEVPISRKVTTYLQVCTVHNIIIVQRAIDVHFNPFITFIQNFSLLFRVIQNHHYLQRENEQSRRQQGTLHWKEMRESMLERVLETRRQRPLGGRAAGTRQRRCGTFPWVPFVVEISMCQKEERQSNWQLPPCHPPRASREERATAYLPIDRALVGVIRRFQSRQHFCVVKNGDK